MVLRPVYRLAAALAPLLCQGCNAAYHARVPRSTEVGVAAAEAIPHCLASLGFEDRSQDDFNPESIQKEPALIAIWSTPGASSWSSTSQTVASVREQQDGWSVTFISRGSSGSAELLSTAFSKCMEVHASPSGVELDSEWFLDLR